MSRKHSKHTKLEKPRGGEFHRNEWGFIGAPCSLIESLVDQLHSFLGDTYSIGWLDADHKAGNRTKAFFTHFTDKIDFFSIESHQIIGQKQFRKYFSHLDALFVNGNHFQADKQIVIINEKKKESLERKLGRLSDPRLFVLDHGIEDIHDYLKGRWDIPIVQIDNIDLIASTLKSSLETSIPRTNGLVLAGGKSVRMGEDKGRIKYHGIEQRDYVAQLIQPYCAETYLSVRSEQKEEILSDFPLLEDTFTGLGPYGGILSAFRISPNSAWLTIACDLPYLSKGSIERLVENRDSSKLATSFHNPDTNFPEPLLTIWEPRAYPILLEFLSMGYSCPRKVLINTDVHQIDLIDKKQILNVNTPQEKEAVFKTL